MKERVVSDFNASRTVILMSKTGIAVEERRFSKKNWRHFLSKIRVKIKKNWHDHWELTSHFKTPQSRENDSEARKLGAVRIEAERCERRLFACEQLLEKQRRKGFLHRIVTGDEKWVHYDNPKRRKSWFPAMFLRRRPNQIFMVMLQGHALYLVGPARRNVL